MKSSASSPVAAVSLDQPSNHFDPLNSKRNHLKSKRKHVVELTDQSDKDDDYPIPISKRKAPPLIDSEDDFLLSGEALDVEAEDEFMLSGEALDEDDFLLSGEALDVEAEDEFMLSGEDLDIEAEDDFLDNNLLRSIKDKCIQQLHDTHQHSTQVNIFIDFVEKAKMNQASVFFLGLCGVSIDRLGNTRLGNVDLGTGDGLTDKCLSVHVMNVIAKDIPQDSYFVCNVRPSCILKKDKIHCKECDEGECTNMVELLTILHNFTKETDGKLCVINVGGRSTEKIVGALISSNIFSPDNVHGTGFHLCTLGTYRANMCNQTFECSQFIESIDSFLNAYYGNRLQLTILEDCINDTRMRFVVKIDPLTAQECEEHRKQRSYASRLRRNAKHREWYANLSEDRREEIRAKRREWYTNLSEDRREEIRAKRREWYANLSEDRREEIRAKRREWYANLSEDRREEIRARKRRWFTNLSKDRKEEVRARRREWYAKLSKDQKAEVKARKQRWFANLSEERKAGMRMRNNITKLKWWDNMCEEKKNVHRDRSLEYNQKKRNTMTDEHRAEINAETKKRQRERRQSDLAGSIPSNPPTQRDIVLGQRAMRWKNHPGNLWITSVSIQRKQDYKSTRSRIDKDAILRNIISSTISDGRRFVHMQNNNWFEASDDLARTYLRNKITDI